MSDSRDPKLRHARYYVRFAQEHRKDYDRLDQELPNIRAVANNCILSQDWQLLTSLTTAINDYLLASTNWTDYVHLNTALITNDLTEEPTERVLRLNQLARLKEFQGSYAEAVVFNELLIPLYEECGDVLSAIEALQRLSKLSRSQGVHEVAYQSLEKGIALARESGYRKGEVDLLHDYAILLERRDSARANTLCDAAIDTARSFGYLKEMIDLLLLKASLLLTQREFQSSMRSAQEALAIATQVNDIDRADNIRAQLAKLGKLMEKNIFISYSHQDKGLVERLANDLKAAGLAVWWDQWEVKVGQSIVQKVSDGIESSAYLIAVLSPHSSQSNWVQQEIGSAMMKQLSAERGITILPLLAADCEVPILLRAIKWADFRTDYGLGLKSLLDVLVTDGQLPNP